MYDDAERRYQESLEEEKRYQIYVEYEAQRAERDYEMYIMQIKDDIGLIINMINTLTYKLCTHEMD